LIEETITDYEHGCGNESIHKDIDNFK